MFDRDDVEQALEIACGDTIPSGQGLMTHRRTVSQRAVDGARHHIMVFLRELPADLTVQEVLEAIDDET